MAVRFERIVAQDLNLGKSTVEVTMPAGGTAIGDQINLETFQDEGYSDAFSSSNFTSNSGTWTVGSSDVLQLKGWTVGKLMHLSFSLTATETSSAGTELRFVIPDGRSASNKEFTGVVQINSGGTITTGTCRTLDAGTGGATKIAVYKADGSAWGTIASLAIRGEITFEMVA